MTLYTTNPLVVEAMQFSGMFSNYDAICDWAGIDFPANTDPDSEVSELYIDTIFGRIELSINDWIIKGLDGEFSACKADNFKIQYEEKK